MEKDLIKDSDSYLSFMLGKEYFASHVSNVLSILALTDITKIPKTPDYMKGVINLRGNVLPVVDVRAKFGMPEIEFTNHTCIIVLSVDLENEKVEIGALVDNVDEVLKVDKETILDPPNMGEKYKSSFVKGIIKHNEQFIILLNINKIFSVKELSSLKKTDKIEEKK